jgi:hypothetical protein
MLRPYDETDRLGDHQIHELVGHYNLFYNALAVDVLGYGWFGERFRNYIGFA